MMPVAFEHDKLMSLFKLFDGIFNVEFLDSLAHIDWPEFSNDYKRIVEQIMQEEYGWSNKGQDVIEEYLGKTITALQEEAKKKRGRKKPLKDTDDYQVMAAAIIHNADIIVTYNLKDFIDPFGRIRVMNLDMFLSQPIQDSLF